MSHTTRASREKYTTPPPAEKKTEVSGDQEGD